MGLSALEAPWSLSRTYLSARPIGRFSHEDRDLPQLVIPELLYNALIAALSMAASYHFFTLVIEWWKSRSSKRS
jgi:hypothetical protein